MSDLLYFMEIDCAAPQILNNGLCSKSNLRCCAIDSLYHECYRAPYNCLLVLHKSVLTGYNLHTICHEPKVKVGQGMGVHKDPLQLRLTTGVLFKSFLELPLPSIPLV